MLEDVEMLDVTISLTFGLGWTGHINLTLGFIFDILIIALMIFSSGSPKLSLL
jgi:hypothetical protein